MGCHILRLFRGLAEGDTASMGRLCCTALHPSVLQVLQVPHLAGQPKVAQFELPSVGVEDIRGLEVAVQHPIVVQVGHAAAGRGAGGQ